MQNIIEDLALILPAIAIFGVLFVLLLNLYLKIRRLIPVKVNCWFCNQWTKVHYDTRNCFECPSCLQYNGFNLEGDYNKIIPAQHDELLNHDVIYNQQSQQTFPKASNGLCSSCNNNSRLKVFQLANFVPLNENNYEAEIEHFEQQLNKSYKLCAPCEIVVKATLRRQNEILGLKLPNIRKKGIRLLDFNSYSKSRRNSLIKTIGFLLMAIVFCNVIYILSQFDYSNDSLSKVTPQKLFPYVLRVKESFQYVQSTAQNYFNNLLINNELYAPLQLKKDINFQYNAKMLCCLGVLLQLVLLFLSDDGRTKKIFQVLGWGLLVWLSWNYPVANMNYNNYAQIITNITIVLSMCVTWSRQIKTKKLKRKSSHKIKHQRSNNKDIGLSTSGPKIIKREPKEHFTEFSKPHFTSDINSPKNSVSYSDYPKSPICAYNLDNVLSKPLNLQDDLITDLTKLNLGKLRKQQDRDYENPFRKMHSPSYNNSNTGIVWGPKRFSNSNCEFLLPSTPSSFTLKVQFSTDRRKF